MGGAQLANPGEARESERERTEANLPIAVVCPNVDARVGLFELCRVKKAKAGFGGDDLHSNVVVLQRRGGSTCASSSEF